MPLSFQATDRCAGLAADPPPRRLCCGRQDAETPQRSRLLRVGHSLAFSAVSISGDGHPARHRATVYQVRRPCQPLFFEFVFNYTVVGHGWLLKAANLHVKPKVGFRVPLLKPMLEPCPLPFLKPRHTWDTKENNFGIDFSFFCIDDSSKRERMEPP